ncbi:MAG: WbqC family protein, partial [Bacteroidales bacterium]|nr:WbqC family protein [Bacteroidales bacterium]
RPVEYKQFNDPFIPNLSILDVLMFNSVEQTNELLLQFDLVES